MIRSAQEAEKFAVAGDVYALLASGKETNGAYALNEARVPPGGGPPLHTQSDVELFYILQGEVTFTVGDQEAAYGPGTHLRVEKGVLHAFQNRSDQPVRMLMQTMPAGLDPYFREVGQPVNAMDDHQPATPEELEVLMATAPKYGIQIKT